MKNLTRVLALVLALTLVLGTVAFASFTDVKAGDDYAEAIETLAALGIIKGYEDGSFGGEKAITRAEAVAIINRIQNLGKAAEGAATISLYTDVAADHWALGDINLATQMGVISGDGNGKFRPDDQVSYQEMVKMLTCALGYQPAVAELGGWPTGYLVAAQSQGILDDTVNVGAAPANRAVVAQLTYNAIHAPMMVQVTYGTEQRYVYADGSNTTFVQTLLDKKLKIYKTDAYVTATDVYGAPTAKVGYATLTAAGTEPYFGVEIPSNFFVGGTELVKVGNSSVNDKYDYRIISYLQKNADKEWEVIYNTVEEDTNIEIAFETATVERVVPCVANATDPTVTDRNGYLVVVDEDGKETRYYTDVATALVKGTSTQYGTQIDINDFKFNANEYLDGNVKLLYGKKNDDTIHKIYVELWNTAVVEDIAPNGTVIYVENAAPIKLDTEANDKLVYSLTMDGKDIAVTDLQEGDVLTYVTTGANYYDILVSRETVEGSVDAYYSDDNIYTIAGSDYKAGNNASANLTGDALAGQSGVFYLDAFGKLVDFERNANSKGTVNYGYILGYLDNDELVNGGAVPFEYEITAQLLTKDGISKVEFADKVYVTPVVKNARGEMDASNRVPYNFSDPQALVGGQRALTALKAELAKFVGLDLIDYTLNADGEIASISYYDGATFETVGGKNNGYISVNADLTSADFSERKSTIGGYTVSENTAVFYVGGTDKEDYAVKDINFLVDDEDYAELANAVTVYGMDEDRVADAILIRKLVSNAAARENVAVYVSSSTVKNEDEISIKRISYYQGGELKTIDCDITITNANLAGFNPGDLIEFTTNVKGLVTNVAAPTGAAVNNYAGIAATPFSYGYPVNAQANTITYVFGAVRGRENGTLKLGENGLAGESQWDSHKIDDETNVYIVERKATGKVVVNTATFAEITKNLYYGANGNDGAGNNAYALYHVDDADNYFVIVKYVGNDVIDVVAYKNFETGVAVQ